MFFWDPTFFMLIPALLLGLYAQAKVRSNFKKFSAVTNSQGLDGARTARLILDQNQLQNVGVEKVAGKLSDHYDPKAKMVRLSESNFNGKSIASVAIAAHECGHAIQDSKEYVPLKFRTALLPVANLGSWAFFPLFILGMLFSMTGLLQLGIIFFAFSVLFQIVTLPVEFNASSRALVIVTNNGLLNGDELTGAKKVLSAAALTYVASALMSLLQLLRLVLISSMTDD